MKDLTNKQIIDLAHTVPGNEVNRDFHDRVRKNRSIIEGKHKINVPDSHKGVFSGANYEGSNRLDKRINQLASYLSRGRVRFSFVPPSSDDDVRAATAAQERFARNAEEMLSRGTALHNWKHETYRDIGESGVSIIQQIPRRGYYIEVEQAPDKMAKGAMVNEVFLRRRIDPLSFSFESTPEGNLGCVVLMVNRPISDIAKMDAEGMENAQKFFNEPFDPTVEESMTGKIAKCREVHWDNGGALVLFGTHSGLTMKSELSQADDARILAKWENQVGRPPFYIARSGTPWISPLSEMIALTETRNYWATIQDYQASGAVFQNWQLIDTDTQEDITYSHPAAKALPESVFYDPSKPPPYMGPNTEWRLAPFEYHDVSNRFLQIQAAHENAGASVARLMGEQMGAYTAVGTADAMDEAASGEFAMLIESLEDRAVEMWRDAFTYIRDHHQDPIQVYDHSREVDSNQFMRTVAEISAKEIKTLHIRARLDLRSRLATIADFRYATEAINAGFMDYDRAVEEGLIPYVDDADVEKLALYISELERVEIMAELRDLAQEKADPRFLTGSMSDPRGTGSGQGPLNASNTGISAGGSDTAAGRVA